MDMARSAPGAKPVLDLRNLRVRYRNGALGIEDVSLQVFRGEVVALLGPNGAGKTTTVRAASGFMKAEGAKITRGVVEFLERDMTNVEPHRMMRAGMCVIPERRKVFVNLSIGENLASVGGKAVRGAERTRRYDYVFDLFPALASRQSELAGRLSGGQQQMLAIARALISEPRMLVIDEMTLGLHHSLHKPLFDVIRKIADDGSSVLVVDESTSSALEVADYCYLLSSGTTEMSGPSDRFIGTELLLAGYFDGHV